MANGLDYDAGSGRYLIKDYDSDGAEDSLYGVLEYFYLLKPNDGVTSLREAIAAAQTGDMIRFAPSLKGKTITLTQGQLEITQGIAVDAGALYDEATQTPGITVDANQASRVFAVSGGTAENPVALRGLTITGGNTASSYNGGGVYVYSDGAATFTTTSERSTRTTRCRALPLGTPARTTSFTTRRNRSLRTRRTAITRWRRTRRRSTRGTTLTRSTPTGKN